MRKLTTEEVIKEFKSFHGDKYDYSLVDYKNKSTKVIIICNKHGKFMTTPSNHLVGRGCPECGQINRNINRVKNLLEKKFRNLIQPQEYKLIPIYGGKVSKVDNEDFDKLKLVNWSINTGYADNHSLGRMHRFIMNCPDDKIIDHINHDILDNRKSNLRISTKSTNAMNLISISPKKTSKYKGVSWDKARLGWLSGIMINRKKINLGVYKSEIEAAKTYDVKARELFGEFALTNFN